MKKILIFALVIATVAVMASCGTGAEATPTPTVEVTPTPTATPVDMIMSGPKANAGTVLYAIANMYMEDSGEYIQWKRTTIGTALAYCVTDNTDVAIIPREAEGGRDSDLR